MAFNKRLWKGRQGTGLNKFSINGATPVTVINQPDSVTQVGDALSAGNLNDLEDRIEDAFDDVDTELDTKADEQDVTNLNNAIDNLDHRLENIEQSKGDYIVSSYKDGSITPSGKGKWCVVEGVEGVSRVENMLFKTSASKSRGGISCTNVDGTLTLSGVATSTYAEIFDTMQIVANHSYLVFFADVVNPNAISFNVGSLNTTVKSYLGTPKVVTSLSGRDNSGMGIESYTSGTNFNGISFKFFIRDLNIYFGTSDLSFLGATDSAKLATIQTNYPHLLQPSEYGTMIVDSNYTGVESGYRYTDAYKWQSGCYSSSGQYQTNNDAICTIDGFAISAGKTVVAKSSVTCEIDFNFFNANGIQLSMTQEAGITSKTAIAPTNCAYVQISYRAVGIDTSKITVTIDGKNFVVIDTLSFPSTTLKSAGSVRDRLELNVEVDGVEKKRETQRIETIADFSLLAWSMNTSGQFYATLSVAGVTDQTGGNVLCPKYLGGNAYGRSDKTVCIVNGSTASYVWLCDLSITSVADLETALTGVPFYYQKGVPTVTLSDPIIDNTLLTESGGRLSTVQTGTVVDGIADLGFITL